MSAINPQWHDGWRMEMTTYPGAGAMPWQHTMGAMPGQHVMVATEREAGPQSMRDVRNEYLEKAEKASRNETQALGLVLCGCQLVRVDVDASEARSDLLKNDQVEEKDGTDNLLQKTSQRSKAMDEEVSAREESQLQAVDETGQEECRQTVRGRKFLSHKRQIG